jgi:hypothetical protein
MNLEPMEPQQPRRERPGYYDRHQHRKPASWRDWAVSIVLTCLIAWLYVVFGGGPV